METLQLWAVGIVVFAAGALSIRIFSPQDLVGETAPNDGEVWALTTAAWAGALTGAFTGEWLRRLRKTR